MLIAVDIGTTNIKALAFAASGRVLAVSERQSSTLCPQPGWQEQDPERVFQNVLSVLAEVWSASQHKETLNGVVFSSAMHGLIGIDAAGAAVGNIILWSDMRADAVACALRSTEAGKRIYQKTGVPIHAMSPLCKLHWLQTSQPAVFQQIRYFLDIKSYVWQRLSGELVTDLSVASASGLLNIHQNDWEPEALEFAVITPAVLPRPVSPAHTFLPDSDRFLSWGLPQGIPYVIGGSDGALANLGSGATAPGQVAVTIGTSAAIRGVSNTAVLDDSMRSFCYRLDEKRFIVGGASNNGTNALEWLRCTVFQSPLSAADFAEQASTVPAGADGLIFLPYLLGERAPLYSAQVRGSFLGLHSGHTQAHFIRAAMEGVLLNIRIISEVLEMQGPIHTLHAGGGFSRNEPWVQMLADIFRKPVYLPQEQADASLLGAFYFANRVLGLEQVVENQAVRVVEPNLEQAGIYQEVYQRFKARVG